MANKEVIFDVKKALNNECEDMGIFTINKIIGNLQIAYMMNNDELIKSFENVVSEYYKDPNKNKIDLVYINPKADFWTFIENDE